MGRSDGLEIVERDDGFIQANFGPKTYLSGYQDWASHEKAGIRYARGTILDTGCAAGRHALYLQNRGHRVLGRRRFAIGPSGGQNERLEGDSDSFHFGTHAKVG